MHSMALSPTPITIPTPAPYADGKTAARAPIEAIADTAKTNKLKDDEPYPIIDYNISGSSYLQRGSSARGKPAEAEHHLHAFRRPRVD